MVGWAFLWAEGVVGTRCGRVVAVFFDRPARPPADQPEDPSVLLHVDDARFMLHGGGDEPEMAGVPGEPAIATGSWRTRASSSREHATTPQRSPIDQNRKPLPIFRRVIRPPAPRRAVRSVRDVRASRGTLRRYTAFSANGLARRPRSALRPSGRSRTSARNVISACRTGR